MDGYNRIKEQYLALTEKEDALKKITLFLIKQPDINSLFLNEEKNLSEMMTYIKNLAKEKAVNNVAVIEDITVYNWAIDNFSKSNEELGIKKDEDIKPKEKIKENDNSNNNQLKLELECT